MDFQNDYVLRIIEQITAAIGKIVFLKNTKGKEEALREMDMLSFERFGLDINEIEKISYEDILNLLLEKSSHFNEDSKLIAELLNIKGDIYLKDKNITDAYNCYLKSLNIYIYLNIKGYDMIIFDENKKIEEIIEKIDDYDIPLETEVMIFKYRFNNGSYSKAENTLFSLLEKHNNDELLKMGFDFYNELRKKTEEELKLGDFTFQKIDQGIEDLNKLKRNEL